VHDIRKAVLI
jgi:16S rRNA (cytosine967-C5)-methyltransferase